jgi:hypothetical protein
LSVRPPASVFRLVFLPPFLTSSARRPSPSIAVHPLAACCPSPVAPSIVQRLPFVVRRLYPVARRRTSFRCRSVRTTAFVSAESRPACLRELLAVSFRSGSVGLPFLEKASAFRSLVAAPFLTK